MALARIRGQVSNADLRDATGLDTLAASVELRGLRDRGITPRRRARVKGDVETAVILDKVVPGRRMRRQC
jgi:hypothetical protein